MSKKYSSQIANMLVSHMEDCEYKYEFDRDNGIIRLNFTMKGKINKIRFVIDVREWGFVTYGLIDMGVDEEQRKEVAEFLIRVNYRLSLGCFDMDFSDGEIRYKFYVDCDDCTTSSTVIEDSMNMAIATYEKYGDSLLRVMFGMESAEEAYKAVENK